MENATISKNVTKSFDLKWNEWFENFINSIEIDKMMIDAGVANPETEELYKHFVNRDIEKIAQLTMDTMHKRLTESIIINFVHELIYKRNKKPIKIAFDSSDSKVLVWAEIEDEDESTEDALLLTEAKLNHHIYDYNYHVSTTIVEKSDNLNIPNQYKELKIGG